MAPPPFPARPMEVKIFIHSLYRLWETKFNAFQEQVSLFSTDLGSGGGGIKQERKRKKAVGGLAKKLP